VDLKPGKAFMVTAKGYDKKEKKKGYVENY
jgi:hypothetical protein